MKREKVQKLHHGLYKVWWKSGGSSLAAVGSTITGKRWIAPTNWVSGSDDDWDEVKKVKLIKE